MFVRSIWSEPDRLPFPVKLKIFPLNVEGLSSINVPVELAKVTDAELAAASSNVAPAPIVTAPIECAFTFTFKADEAVLTFPADVVSVAVKA